jgi:large subunit ribosomal protein L23
MSKLMALKPRLSEKSVAMSQNDGTTYVFAVPADATKHTVAQAVSAQFDVKVEEVNMLVLKGKSKRTVSQKGRRALKGRASDVKKAYVKLAVGQKLPIFEAIEEEESKTAEKQDKLDKAFAKQAEKEAKQESKSSHRGLHLPSRRSGNRGGDK